MVLGSKRLSAIVKPKKDIDEKTSTSSDGDAPPAYENVVNEGPPEVEVNISFADLSLSTKPTGPTVNTCLAHLRLLEAFGTLKDDITSNDGVFGLWDSRVPTGNGDEQSIKLREQQLAQVREKRWLIYVARAVDRFQVWWDKVLCQREEGSTRLTLTELASPRMVDFPYARNIPVWSPGMLPPLDVLMVWHSFMLNPRKYLEDCMRFGLKGIWAMGMPWHSVNAVIDDNFSYNPPPDADRLFYGLTGHAWDNLEDFTSKEIVCPRCGVKNVVPWVTSELSEGQVSGDFDKEMLGKGYAEKNFRKRCIDCSKPINHDLLQLNKIRKDTEALLLYNYTLRGGILPRDTAIPKPLTSEDPETLPSRLIKEGLRAKVLETITYNTLGNPSVDDVRKLLEDNIEPKVLKGISGRKGATELSKDERIAVRRFMACYWNNSSIFSMDLVGAVIRQGTFVDKMHNIDWLHSPAATATMDRLIEKYHRFFNIMRIYPSKVVVPTLDVDLAWHTHQLSPRQYLDYSIDKTRRFIDHDDKIEEGKLSTAFEWTSKTYERIYSQVYSECTCWYCEAVRTVNTRSGFFGRGRSSETAVVDEFYKSGQAKLCPPENSAHISAHNAVRLSDSELHSTVQTYRRNTAQKRLEAAYQKACKRARARGRPEPKRGNPDTRSANGYSADSPYLVPYWITPYYYPMGDPCGIVIAGGMAGGCVAGTCGGRVAAGSCGSCQPGSCSGGCGTSAVGGCSSASVSNCSTSSAGNCSSGTANCGSSGGCGGGGGGCGGGGS